MPILQIRGLPKEEAAVKSMLSAGTVERQKAMDLRPHYVWGTWKDIPFAHYVEGGKAIKSRPEDTHPPLVDFLAFEGRPQEKIERAILVAAKVITETLGLGK